MRHTSTSFRPWLHVLVSSVLLVGLGLGTSTPAGAQIVIDLTESIDFDRPESWAMQWFGSLALLTAMRAPRDGEAGRIDVGGDLTWVPSLSEDQRRVGFAGIKVEDLNRTDVFGHLRASFGLPSGLLLDVGWTPPVTIDGIEPHVLAAALSRPFLRRPRYRLGWRALAQYSQFEGDITCDATSVAGGSNPDINPFRCLERSEDGMEIWTGRGELRFGWLFPSKPGLELFADVGLNVWEMEFEVDARFGGVDDHTVLETDGTTWSTAAGVAYQGERFGGALEAFFTPLEVVRTPGGTSENDDLFTIRALVTIRVH